MPPHHVLIPIDGSEFARHVFAHVITFLPPEDNQIFLLRVGEPPEGYVGQPPEGYVGQSPEGYVSQSPEGYASHNIIPGTGFPMYGAAYELEQPQQPIYASQQEQTLESRIKSEMEPDREQLQAAGYQVRSFVRFGEPEKAIVDFVSSHDIELVAITTHGRQGVNRLLFGSVAQYVAQHVTIPLLMVRSESDE